MQLRYQLSRMNYSMMAEITVKKDCDCERERCRCF